MAVKKTAPVSIKPMEIQRVKFTIEGDTPLIVHAWSEKAKRMMLQKQMKKTKTAKEAKIPTNDAIDSGYWLTNKPEHGQTEEEAQENFNAAIAAGASFGFPTNGIKASIVMGAYRAGLIDKTTELKGAMFITGAGEHSTFDLAEIAYGGTPNIREDIGMIGAMSKTADLRYRLEFWPWSIDLVLEYDATGKFSLEQILNCVDRGGRYSGLGEWRPERDGHNGMYHLKA